MDSKKRRARAREKSRRQASRKRGTTYQSETPIGMLHNFLPEARSDALTRLRREPERLGRLRRIWNWPTT